MRARVMAVEGRTLRRPDPSRTEGILEHDGFGWNQPNPSCPVEPRSPVRANGMRWNRTRFHLIPFRSGLALPSCQPPGGLGADQHGRDHAGLLGAHAPGMVGAALDQDIARLQELLALV